MRRRTALHHPAPLLTTALAVGMLLAGCARQADVDVPEPDVTGGIAVTSPAFADGATLPADYTCEGAGEFPAIAWAALPTQVKAVAVIVYDPDAPGGDYVHRLVTNLDPASGALDQLGTPAGALELPTSTGEPGWSPPCPPEGDDPHRYVFAVYGLARPTRLPTTAVTQTAVATVTEAAVAEGDFTATFSR